MPNLGGLEIPDIVSMLVKKKTLGSSVLLVFINKICFLELGYSLFFLEINFCLKMVKRKWNKTKEKGPGTEVEH